MAEPAFAVRSHAHGKPAWGRFLVETERSCPITVVMGAHFDENYPCGPAMRVSDLVGSPPTFAAGHCERNRATAMGDLFKFRRQHGRICDLVYIQITPLRTLDTSAPALVGRWTARRKRAGTTRNADDQIEHPRRQLQSIVDGESTSAKERSAL
jgi:hypothetical protein